MRVLHAVFFLPQLPGLQIFSWNVMSQCRYNGQKTNRAQAAQRTTSFSVPLMQACRLAVLSTSDPISARPAPTSQMDRAPPSDDGFNKNEGSDEYERRILQAARPSHFVAPRPCAAGGARLATAATKLGVVQDVAQTVAHFLHFLHTSPNPFGLILLQEVTSSPGLQVYPTRRNIPCDMVSLAAR